MRADGLTAVQRPRRGLTIAVPAGFEIDIDEVPASRRAAAATAGTFGAVGKGEENGVAHADRFVANRSSGFADYACSFVAENCWVFASVSEESVSEQQILWVVV